jgi:hypothetical protein
MSYFVLSLCQNRNISDSGSQAYASQQSLEDGLRRRAGSTIKLLHTGATAADCASKLNEMLQSYSKMNIVNGTSESSISSNSHSSISHSSNSHSSLSHSSVSSASHSSHPSVSHSSVSSVSHSSVSHSSVSSNSSSSYNTEFLSDPLFNGSGSDPYILNMDSPDRNSGHNYDDSPTDDILGEVRGNPPNLGAYEDDSNSSVSSVNSQSSTLI